MKKTFIILAFLSSIVFAQKTNLVVFYDLIEKTCAEIYSGNLNEKSEIQLILTSKEYNRLNKHFQTCLNKNENLKFVNNSENKLEFIIDSAKVEYPEMLRDGWFGDYMVKRKISLGGKFIINNTNGKIKSSQFFYSFSDSVMVTEVDRLSNMTVTYTVGELPEEPFFESLVEPVIIVGSTVVAIILFFTVRS